MGALHTPFFPVTYIVWLAIVLDCSTRLFYFCRLCCEDGSEFLFLANSDTEMEEWVNKIQFHAQLPPSLQLLSYDESQKVCTMYSYSCFSIVRSCYYCSAEKWLLSEIKCLWEHAPLTTTYHEVDRKILISRQSLRVNNRGCGRLNIGVELWRNSSQMGLI